jgi:hypothetical protein
MDEAANCEFGGCRKHLCVVAVRSTAGIRAALSTLDCLLVEIINLLHVQHSQGFSLLSVL